MRRLIVVLALILVSIVSVNAERFRIATITYVIDGITRQYAIENAVEISTSRIFYSYEELHSYISDIEQKLINQRVFSSSIVNLAYDFENNDGLTLINLRIFTSDSKHLMIIPYPKYDSNTGLTLKIKVKDMNFLGTMNVLNSDISFESGENSDTGEWENTVGINFAYDYPFRLGPFKTSWNNDFGINYTFGKSKPEFNVSTGFSFELPFDMFSICLTLTQSIARNFDYTKYDDELYFTEAAKFSVPITLANIDNWGKVTWSPYVSYAWNWDTDGISTENKDLSSPILSIGHSISTARVNWIGNFRQGVSASAGESIGYNYQKEEFIPKVWAELIGYKAFKYVGLSGRAYGFAVHNGEEKIGSKLRGIKDDQKFVDTDKKALEVPSALVCNIDMPIHIITTDWNKWFAFLFGEDSKITKAFHFMHYLDFELQLSPFVDFALTKNEVTGRTFSIQDGFYAAGIEAIVFPQKWRSIEVRASFGVDVGRKVIKKAVSKLIDDSWRSGVSAYELYIGIGLHY